MSRLFPLLAMTWMFVCLAAGGAPAQTGGGFTIGRLKYDGGGDWYANPTSLPRLLAALGERTSIQALPAEKVVTLDDPDLYTVPMLYATGHGNIRFSDGQLERLRNFLEGGGFFWADDNFGMDESLRRELKRIYPDKDLVAVPFDHALFRQKYVFANGPPKIHRHNGGPAQCLALFHKGRMIVLYTFETDIGDGLEPETVHHDPAEVREQALQFAINTVLFALTQP